MCWPIGSRLKHSDWLRSRPMDQSQETLLDYAIFVSSQYSYHGYRRFVSLAIKCNIRAITSKRYETGCQLVLITNKKTHTGFQLVPKSVTLNDLERRHSPYFALYHGIR